MHVRYLNAEIGRDALCEPSAGPRETCMDEDLDRRSTEGPPTEDEIVEALRRDLLADLPRLLAKAIRGYERFTVEHPPEDAKAFVAYQTGCRAALTHIHLLVKLAHWASPRVDQEAAPVDDEQLDRMVREAETALRNHPLDD